MSSFDTSAAGTVNFPLKKSQKLPQKVASHWGDSQIKIESFWPQTNEAQIDSFQSWKGGGRPAKGVIFYSSSCKVAFGHKNGVVGKGLVKKRLVLNK